MSQENVCVVKELFAAAMRGDVEGVVACAAPDVVIDRAPHPSAHGGVVHFEGHEGIREYFAMLDERWIGRAEVQKVIDANDGVVVSVRLSAGPTSMLTLGPSAAWVAQVRHGKVVRLTIYRSQTEALAAVGLSE
jgi:ketosteroid isomerase-like protein